VACQVPNPDFGKTPEGLVGETVEAGGAKRDPGSMGGQSGAVGGSQGGGGGSAGQGQGIATANGGGPGADAAGPGDGAPGGGHADGSAAAVEAAPKVLVNGDLKKGLTLYLPLEDQRGSGAAADLSGKGCSAALRSFDANAAWIMGRVGTALALQGSSWNGWLDVSGTALTGAISQSFTVGMWIWRTDQGGTLFARGIKGALLTFGLDGANLTAQLNTAAAYKASVRAGVPVPAGDWHHVAMTFDLKEVRLYLNGKIAGVAPYQQGIPLDTTSYVVGALPQANGTVSARFTGKIDEVVLYTRVLTADELQGLAAGAQPVQ
jgi:hypothetical protein